MLYREIEDIKKILDIEKKEVKRIETIATKFIPKTKKELLQSLFYENSNKQSQKPRRYSIFYTKF